MSKPTKNRFPPGWNEGRVKKVVAHYDRQSDDKAIAEDSARVKRTQTTMRVPSALVGKVRNLIAQHQQRRRSA
jgi:hypothetical protein